METQHDDQSNDRGENLSPQLIPVDGVRLAAKPHPEPSRVESTGFLSLEVDSAIFSLDAVLRAAYKFTDRCHLFLQSSAVEGLWLLMLRPKAGQLSAELAGEFANELIDQRLREKLEQQFGNLRTLIVAQAFSEGNLLDRDRADGDHKADPRGIGTSR